MMDILMSETCWAYKKWNKIASDIKLVFYSSRFRHNKINCEILSHFFFWRKPSRCESSIIYCISTVNTQHTQRPDVLVQLGYIWPHVSAVKRPWEWPFNGQNMSPNITQLYQYIWSLHMLCIDGTNTINNWRYTTGWLPSNLQPVKHAPSTKLWVASMWRIVIE